MIRREALLLLALLPVAVGAALLYRPASSQRELQAARFEVEFEAAVERLPLLDAVRIRSDQPGAAHRIEIAGAPGIASVVDARRARDAFQYGRLLYATDAELEQALTLLRQGELPSLPPVPDSGITFFDLRGPFDGDVILADETGLDRIRELAPTATLGGEPIARDRERREGGQLTQALLAAIALAALVFVIKRDTALKFDRRLAAALLPALALGALGWGVDAPTLAALLLAICAAEGAPLWIGALLIFFPPAALQRVGVVLLGAWLVRGPSKGLPTRRPRRAVLLGWLVLVVGFVVATGDPVPQSAPEVETGQSVRFGDAIDLHPLLPDPIKTPARRILMRKIYDRAELLAQQSTDPDQRERFEEVARAAARTELHFPRSLVAYLRTTDGHEAIWSNETPDLADPRWHSADLSRLRGDLNLQRHARWAAVLMLALLAIVRAARTSPQALAESLALIAVAVGGAILVVGSARFGGSADLWLPLIVAGVAAAPQRAYLPMIAAGLIFPTALGVPMAALLAVAVLSRRSR